MAGRDLATLGQVSQELAEDIGPEWSVERAFPGQIPERGSSKRMQPVTDQCEICETRTGENTPRIVA